MIERIYADNYKSFVDFELKPGPVQLLLGPNGSGKSTVRHLLSALRSVVVDGVLASEAFPPQTLTRWDRRTDQRFELAVSGNGGRYDYRLEIEHPPHGHSARILAEWLHFDGEPLFTMLDGKLFLYDDDSSTVGGYPTSGDRSGLYGVPPRDDLAKHNWFKSWMAQLCCVRIDPLSVRSDTDREDPHPDETLANFASWYRHLAQERPGAVHELFESLASGVIDGFKSLNLVRMSEEARVLKVEVEGAGASGSPTIQRYDLAEISDGQRSLLMLYALLHGAMAPGTTLLVDDPVAYVSLAEIQPWLTALIDRADDLGAQVFLISHHPEIVNHLAPSHGLAFHRDGNGPARARPFADPSDSGLPPAELIARGWDGE